MPVVVTISSDFPILKSDRRWFRLNSSRVYRKRGYVAGEFVSDERIILFTTDDQGHIQEINTVIVKRFEGFRKRLFFYTAFDVFIRLTDDLSIVAFLLSRGIDPDALEPFLHPRR